MEKLAYSRFGKLVCTAIRNVWYPTARVHWVQQAVAELDLSRLARHRR